MVVEIRDARIPVTSANPYLTQVLFLAQHALLWAFVTCMARGTWSHNRFMTFSGQLSGVVKCNSLIPYISDMQMIGNKPRLIVYNKADLSDPREYTHSVIYCYLAFTLSAL